MSFRMFTTAFMNLSMRVIHVKQFMVFGGYNDSIYLICPLGRRSVTGRFLHQGSGVRFH